MESKHTSGIWYIEENQSPYLNGHVITDGGMQIAHVEAWDGEQDSEEEKQAAINESLANAKLIASAPELLEALKTIQNVLENWNSEGKYTNLIEHAKTASNKATI